MNVPATHVRMEQNVKMKLMDTHVTAKLVMKVCTVRQTQMNVPVTPVRMVPHVQTKLMDICAPVQQDLLVSPQTTNAI